MCTSNSGINIMFLHTLFFGMVVLTYLQPNTCSFKDEVVGNTSSFQPSSRLGRERNELGSIPGSNNDDLKCKDPSRKIHNDYLDKTKENPRYEVTSHNASSYIQYMKDPVAIGKFMGIFPYEKYLIN
jgi:hypothetical protein